MKKIILVFAGLLCVWCTRAQQGSVTGNDQLSVFARVTQQVGAYKPDTSAVPNDKLTHAIIKLRNLKGGFNINEAVEYKIAEERPKKELPAEQIDKLSAYLTKGDGKRLLDNAVVHIYRNTFTYHEVKQMIRFYRSGAGQKMAETFPVVMLECFAAGEYVKGLMR